MVGGLFAVRCGQCMACRISRSAEWSARWLHELDYFDKSAFVTLTYSWEKVPRIGRRLTLRKFELQLALKRLRKQLPGREIKYLACGEYGDKLGRPHYHLVVLGVGYEEHEVIKNGPLKGIAISGPFVDVWSGGHVFVGTVTRSSIRYVADYLKKCWKGKRGREVYGASERPFQLVSQGVGKRYAIKNEKQIRALLGLTVHGEQIGLPRYYRKVLDITCDNTPELAERGAKAQLEVLERLSGEVLEEGIPDGLTFDGAVRKKLKSIWLQRDIDLARQVEIKRKGRL